MAESDLQFDITADVDQAVAALNKLEGKVEDAGDAAEDAGDKAKDGGDGWASMGGKVAKAGIAIAATTIALKAVVDGLISFGNELERQAGIMNRFTGDITDATARLNGLVSQMDLMIASNKLAQAGISATSEEFGALAVAAQQAADALGTDFNTEMQKITQALATGGVDALREYGIVIETTGDKSVDTARALEAFRVKMDGVKSSADTAGGAIQKMAVAMADAESEFLAGFDAVEDLTPALERLAEASAELTRALAGTSTEFTLMERTGAAVAAIVSVLADRLASLAEGVTAIVEGNLQIGLQLLAQGFAGGAFDEAVARSNAALTQLRENKREAEQITGGGGTTGNRRAGSGGGPDLALTAQDMEAFIAIEEERAARQLEIERDLQDQLNALLQQEAEERKRTADEVAQKEIDAIREVSRAMQEAKARDAAQRAKIGQAEEQSAAAQMQLTQDVVGTSIAAGDQLVGAFAKTQGQMELWQGISDAAMAITKFASYDYASGALFLLSSGLHFGNAAQMGVGGGGGGQGQAASAAAPAQPVSAPGGSSQGEGGGTVVVNFNSPMAEPLIGRDLMRAQRASEQRFGT